MLVIFVVVSFVAMETTLEGLSFAEDETGGFVIDVDGKKEREVDVNLCMIGRFLADRTIQTHVMVDRLSNFGNQRGEYQSRRKN